jgi:hypothetical protein
MIDPAEIKRVHQLANANLQAVMDALWGRNYQPASLTLELNPAAQRAARHIVFNHAGGWADYGTSSGHGTDLISLVEHVTGVDRERCFLGLRDLVDRLPPPFHSPLRPNIESHEVERPPAKVRTIGRLT